jgi:hypothetical protein
MCKAFAFHKTLESTTNAIAMLTLTALLQFRDPIIITQRQVSNLDLFKLAIGSHDRALLHRRSDDLGLASKLRMEEYLEPRYSKGWKQANQR